VQVPRDSDDPGYVRSFRLDERRELRAFFLLYNFVVTRDALSTEQCERTIDYVWRFVRTYGDTNGAMPEKISSSLRRWDPSVCASFPGSKTGKQHLREWTEDVRIVCVCVCVCVCARTNGIECVYE
jgi:hypothetical protein